MKKKEETKNKEVFSWKNIFKHFFLDLICIIFDPRDGSPDNGLYSDWEGADFESSFTNEYSKKKYGEIWGFFILIIDLLVFIIVKVWKFREINLLIVLLILSFILSLFLIIRGFLAQKPNESNIKKYRKIERNDLCPCGSGKKYKKCCGK